MNGRSFGVGSVLSLAGIVAAWAPAARGAVVVFQGADTGTAAGDARPNANAAAAGFDAAAGALNSLNLINWEAQTAGDLGPYTPLAGVTVSEVNADATATTIEGIIATDGLTTGFNTTAGGSKHLGHVEPLGNADSSTLFAFAGDGISAFGLYITGTESDSPGAVAIEFTDGQGVPVSLALDERPLTSGKGTTTFIGFVDAADAGITSVRVVSRGNRTTARDAYGLDDIRFTNSVVPEPSGTAPMLIGAVVLASFVGSRRRRR
nr:PEP_exosort: PEP-CTERM protein sorting [uncultured bacterium]